MIWAVSLLFLNLITQKPFIHNSNYSIISFFSISSTYEAPVNKKCFTPIIFLSILYLNRFRRKPDITKFD